jgi:hypothetical protein
MEVKSMSIKKKILVLVLALGSILGFASAFGHGHLCGHCRCHRPSVSAPAS